MMMNVCTACGCVASECECEGGPTFITVESRRAEEAAAKSKARLATRRWTSHQNRCAICRLRREFCLNGKALFNLMLDVAGPKKGS
jgi:hypothetical protein